MIQLWVSGESDAWALPCLDTPKWSQPVAEADVGAIWCNAGNCCRDAEKIEGPCDAKTVSQHWSTNKVRNTNKQFSESQTVQWWSSKAHVVLYVTFPPIIRRMSKFFSGSCQPLGDVFLVFLSYQRRRAFCSPCAQDGSPCRSGLRPLESMGICGGVAWCP